MPSSLASPVLLQNDEEPPFWLHLATMMKSFVFHLVFLTVFALAKSLKRRYGSLNDTELLPERNACSSSLCLYGLNALFEGNWLLMLHFCRQNGAVVSHTAWDLSLFASPAAAEPVMRLCLQGRLSVACGCVVQGPVCAAEDCRAAMESNLGGSKAMADYCFAGTLDVPRPGSERKPHDFAMSLLLRDGSPACFNHVEVRAACRCSLSQDRHWQFPSCRHDFCYASLDMLLGEATGRVCKDLLAGRARAVGKIGIESVGPVRSCGFADQLKACRCTQEEPAQEDDEEAHRSCRQHSCFQALKQTLGGHVGEFCGMVLDTEASWTFRFGPAAAETTDIDDGDGRESPSLMAVEVHGPWLEPAIARDAQGLGCDRRELLEACRCAQPLRCAEDDECYEAGSPAAFQRSPWRSPPRRRSRGQDNGSGLSS